MVEYDPGLVDTAELYLTLCWTHEEADSEN